MVMLNGTDLTTIGFIAQVRHLPRLHGEQSRITPVPGRIGGVRAGGQAGADTLVIEATLTAADHATLLARIDTLARLCTGEVVIRISDITDREWVGRLDASSRFNPSTIAWIAQYEAVTLVFNLADPTARAQVETVATPGDGASLPLVMGTAPSYASVSVQNGAGAAVTAISISSFIGVAAASPYLLWTGSVPSSGLWALTTDPAMAITINGANAIAGLDPVSEFPILPPELTSLIVSVDGGSAPVITVRYRRRW